MPTLYRLLFHILRKGQGCIHMSKPYSSQLGDRENLLKFTPYPKSKYCTSVHIDVPTKKLKTWRGHKQIELS
jgi:hypothetical protein